MILSFTLIFVALAILLLLLYLEGGRNSSRLDDPAGCTRPVDLEAFRNLMDPGEEDFLHSNMPPLQFRAVQRERLRAALEYVENAAHNAAVLLRMGEAATQNADPRIAQAGRQLIDNAVRLRAYALLSTGKLYLRMIFPEARLSYGRLADKYQHLSVLASQLILMQHPTQAARLSTFL